MENASKALLMAGGILIALLVIGALLLMFNQLSEYQKSSSDLVETEQLAKFNEQFTQYERDDLLGTELISLVNKVVDYNKKTGGIGEISYSNKITLTIKINQTEFKKMLGTDPQVFNSPSYTINDKTENNYKLLEQITKYRKYEENNTISNLKKLVSAETKLEGGKKVQDIIGTDFKDENGNVVTDNKQILKNLKNYQEYSSFKTATFSPEQNIEYYDNGQVKSMSFKFVE